MSPSDPAPPPGGERTPATGNRAPRHERPPYDDTVSLRELYLILRRGLPLIALVAVAAALVAFLFASLARDRYEAEASVVSSPSAIRVRDQGTLAFEPGTAISFEAYRTIAQSRAAFEQTLERLEGDGDGDALQSFRDLRGASEVEQLTGRNDAALTVAHRVTGTSPEQAARFANAWAQVSVEQIRATLLGNLEPAQRDTAVTLEERRAELQNLEAEREAFQAENAGDQLEVRLQRLAQRQAANDARIDQLDRRIADARGRMAALDRAPERALGDEALQLLRSYGSGGDAVVPAFPDQPSLPPEDDDERLLIQGSSAALLGDLAAADLAGALQEREAAVGLDARFEEQASELRGRAAELERRETQLERRVGEARDAYTSVAQLQPLIDYVANLTPGNTRVINEATPPVEPSGPSRVVVAALAFMAAALLATLFVFLREAVREPPAVAGPDAPDAAGGPRTAGGAPRADA